VSVSVSARVSAQNQISRQLAEI